MSLKIISGPGSANDSLDPGKLHKAAERALDYHLPSSGKLKSDMQPGNIFAVVGDIDTERVQANLSETLASANAMAADLCSSWRVRGGMLRWAFSR